MKRVRNGVLVTIALIFLFLSQLSYLSVIAAVVVLRACSVGKTDGSGKTDNKNNNSTTMSASADKTEIQTTAGGTQETTASVNDNTTQTTAAMASNGSVVKITDSADEEEYSTNDLYADTVLFGDMIIEGIQDYGYLGTGNIVSDNNLTTDKAHNYISDVKDRTPSKIFLLVGLNDLNYGTRSGTDVAERIEITPHKEFNLFYICLKGGRKG